MIVEDKHHYAVAGMYILKYLKMRENSPDFFPEDQDIFIKTETKTKQDLSLKTKTSDLISSPRPMLFNIGP